MGTTAVTAVAWRDDGLLATGGATGVSLWRSGALVAGGDIATSNRSAFTNQHAGVEGTGTPRWHDIQLQLYSCSCIYSP